MRSLSIVKTLVVLFYVGHISSWALKLPPTTGESLNRNTRQLVTCPGFAGYCSEAYPGDTCTVVCAFGRNNVPECQPDGTWSDEPRCIEHEPGLETQQTKLCPGVPGYCSDSNTGTLCEFDCLIGPDIRSVCTEDGTWGPYPTCDGDIRETRDGCDGCPGPFGGPRNRKKEGGSGSSNGGNRKSQGNGGGSRRNQGNGGNRRNGNGGNRNKGSKKNNRNGGGQAKTAAEALAAKAGALVPGKLPQGRRPPKPKNFDELIKGNSKFISNGNTQQKSSNNNVRKNGNGNGRRNKPKPNSNGRNKNNNGSRNNRPSNKRPKSISQNGSRRNQNKNNGSKRNQSNRNGNKRPSNNRKQNNNRNNFGQKNKGGGGRPSNQNKRKNNRPAKKQNSPPVQKKQASRSSSGACSEAALEACISACPAKIFAVCAQGCANSKLIGCESRKQ